jgi:hypothetical protein
MSEVGMMSMARGSGPTRGGRVWTRLLSPPINFEPKFEPSMHRRGHADQFTLGRLIRVFPKFLLAGLKQTLLVRLRRAARDALNPHSKFWFFNCVCSYLREKNSTSAKFMQAMPPFT